MAYQVGYQCCSTDKETVITFKGDKCDGSSIDREVSTCCSGGDQRCNVANPGGNNCYDHGYLLTIIESVATSCPGLELPAVTDNMQGMGPHDDGTTYYQGHTLR